MTKEQQKTIKRLRNMGLGYRKIGIALELSREERPEIKTGYLCEMVFLRNLLLNENHPLHNRTLHISETFKETEKPDIEITKPNIDVLKPDIEKAFQPKTASYILKLHEKFPDQTIFGRSDVMKVIGIRPSRASELLKELREHGVIESVSGHGKGKCRFRIQ